MRHTYLLAAVMALAGAALGEAAPNPLAPDETSARIQKHRTAEVTLTVTGADGRPLAGAAVTVKQVRHKFLFGCNAFAVNPDDRSAEQKAYQDRFAALMNYATLPFYWNRYERQPGALDAPRVRQMAEWCAARGIRTKGHPLCWHQSAPSWLAEKPLEEIERLQLGRIARDVAAFAPDRLIWTWDVVNEAVVMPGYQGGQNPVAQLCEKLGRPELVKRTFAAARAADQKAFLILNDFDTSPRFEGLVRDCLAAGTAIDAVGIQSHQHGGYWGAARAWDVCERFARLGMPLHFTEATITSGELKKQIDWRGRYADWPSTPEGEARQARDAAEFYRVLFSHPAVEAITWWDFSDARAWLGAPSGLVRKDMSPKPAYEALMQMVKKEWWTGPLALRTDAQGKAAFRGFLGRYEAASGGAAGEFDVAAAGAARAAVALRPEGRRAPARPGGD